MCISIYFFGLAPCSKWILSALNKPQVKVHLQQEVLDPARTAHYERMLAEPPAALCQSKSMEENLREENTQSPGITWYHLALGSP